MSPAASFSDRSVPHAPSSSKLKYTELILTPEFFGKDGEGENALRRVFYTDSEYQPSVTLNQDEREALEAILHCTSRECERRAGDFRAILRLYIALIGQYLARAVERARSELANRDPAYPVGNAGVCEQDHRKYLPGGACRALRYNSAYFRMFKKHMGENLTDYITKKRIESARLVETDLQP